MGQGKEKDYWLLFPRIFCAAVAVVLLQSFCSFVPAPGSQQLRGADQVATSVGLALMTSAPAQAASFLASETPPQSRDEYFSRVMTGAGICTALAAFLVGLSSLRRRGSWRTSG